MRVFCQNFRYQLFLFAFLLVFPAHKIQLGDGQSSLRAQPAHSKKRLNASYPIYLGVSLIWEGYHTKDFNLEALRKLRKEFENVNFFHFLNPRYFLNQSPNQAKKTVDHIKSIVQPTDKVGLILQPSKRLTEYARVIFRPGPTFWGNTIKNCQSDCGSEVPLSIYPEKDIDRLLRSAIEILTNNSFNRPRLFLAGGWLSSKTVQNTIAANRFLYDFSAIPPGTIQRRLGRFPLYQWVQNRWRHITDATQPHIIPTTTTPITQFSFSGGIVDYSTPSEVFQRFKNYASAQKTQSSRPLVFNIGFFQETAAQNAFRLQSMLRSIYAYSEKSGTIIRPLVLPGPSIAVRR